MRTGKLRNTYSWIIYGRDESNTEISARATEFLECREINAHAHAVCTGPSSPPPRGRPGNEASCGTEVATCIYTYVCCCELELAVSLVAVTRVQ